MGRSKEFLHTDVQFIVTMKREHPQLAPIDLAEAFQAQTGKKISRTTVNKILKAHDIEANSQGKPPSDVLRSKRMVLLRSRK